MHHPSPLCEASPPTSGDGCKPCSRIEVAWWTMVTLLVGLLCALGLTVPASAQEQRSWRCLPQETALAICIANGQVFVDVMRTNTKLGEVLFSEARLEQVKDLIVDLPDGEWEEFHEKMSDYGIDPADLPQLLAGESGFALVIDQGQAAPDELSLFVGLGWIQPGEELAERIYTAIGKAVEDYADEEHPVTRVDIELEGMPVMHLTVPVHSSEMSVQDGDFESDEEGWDEQEPFDEEMELPEEVEIAVGYVQMLLVRLDGRLLIAHIFNPTDDPEAHEHVERLSGTFARFLAAHSGEGGPFVDRLMEKEGVANVMDEGGVPAIEFLVDLARLLDLGAADPAVAQSLEAMGLNGLGAAAMRLALDGQVLRQGLFISAPSPRAGLLALLDQLKLAPEPPPWVPANLVSYNHISADLGNVYSSIKQIVLAQFPEQGAMAFHMVEAQVNQMAQTDLMTLLSSIGHQHIILTYEPVFSNVGESHGGDPMQQRLAVVWQIKDEALWARVLQAVAPMVLGEGVGRTEEQGFSGWRFQGDGGEGGLFLGKGYLVFAMGQSSLEWTLSSLNAPPKGEDALLTGEVFAKAQTLIHLEPGLNFQLADGDRYAHMMKRMFDTMFDLALASPVGPDGTELETLEALSKLLPTDDELENVLGASASYVRVNKDGLVVKGIKELPSPE